MDILARPRLIAEEKLSKTRVRRTYEVDVSNGTTLPVTVEVRQNPNLRAFKVVAEPQKHDIRQGEVAWRIGLAAGQARTFRYTIEYDS
jgi:hypothetical protein